MKKQSLKLFEILNLETEINGFTNHNTGEILIEGLLNQPITYGVKLDIKMSLKYLIELKKEILAIQDELITKYGTIGPDGMASINKFIIDEKGKEIINDNYLNFQKEWNDFLNSNEKEIEFPVISINELINIKTKDNYNIIEQYFLSK